MTEYLSSAVYRNGTNNNMTLTGKIECSIISLYTQMCAQRRRMQRKTERLHMRVEPKVKQGLQKEAKELGVPVSELIRIYCAQEKIRLDREMYQRIEEAIKVGIREALSG